MRPQALHHRDQRQLIEQVRLDEIDTAAQMLDAGEILRAGSAHHAEHLISLVQQQLREIGTVLPGDAGDERAVALRVSHSCTRP